MTILPLSEVKARLSEIADEVERTHERVLVTKNGREHVVLMSVDDLEAIEATLELLSDPAAQERVRKAQADIARGDYTTGDEMAQMMAERRSREGDR